MNRFRMPLIMMAGGFAAKSVAVIFYRLVGPTGLPALLMTYDPLGWHFAEMVLRLFFDLRGIAPPAAAPAVFEVLLVAGFGAQCFILGLAINEGRGLLRSGAALTRTSGG
jgi:hypothetical protein